MTVGRTLLASAAFLLAALLLIVLGFEWPFVIGWSVLVVALGLLAQLDAPPDPSADEPRIPLAPDRRPTEISRLAWALNTRTGLSGDQMTRRVREILRHRLRRYGIDPDDPAQHGATSDLLGSDLWERLAGPRTTIVDIERSLDAIDRLDPMRTSHDTDHEETP